MLYSPSNVRIPFRFNLFESIDNCTLAYVCIIFLKIPVVRLEVKYIPSLLLPVEEQIIIRQTISIPQVYFDRLSTTVSIERVLNIINQNLLYYRTFFQFDSGLNLVLKLRFVSMYRYRHGSLGSADSISLELNLVASTFYGITKKLYRYAGRDKTIPDSSIMSTFPFQ